MDVWKKTFFHAYVKMIVHPNMSYFSLMRAFDNWLERNVINEAEYAILVRFTILIKGAASPKPFEESTLMQSALKEYKGV